MPKNSNLTRVTFYQRKDNGRWSVQYTPPGGKRVRETVGNRSEAIALAGKIQTDLFNGVYFPERVTGGKTLGDLSEHCLADAALRRKDIENDQYQSVKVLAYFGPGKRLDSFRPADIVGFRNHIASEPLSWKDKREAGTVNQYLRMLSTWFTAARENGWIHRSPVLPRHRLPAAKGRERLVLPEELRILMGAADPEMRVVMCLAIETMMRLGEIVDLKWTNIDRDNWIARLPAGTTKNGKARSVPLRAAARQALETLPRRKDGRVFNPLPGGRPAKRLPPAQLWSRAFARLRKSVGITDLRFHDFRHTSATLWRRRGADIVVIKNVGGWLTWSMVERYQHVDGSDLIAGMKDEILTEHLTAISTLPRKAGPTGPAGSK